MSKTIFDAFGYLWKFGASRHKATLPRWILLPTISVFCEQTTFADHDIRYWNIDFIWLKDILTIEVEQLDMKVK